MFCRLRGYWRTIKGWIKTGSLDYKIGGCTLKTKEIHENCSVEISYCEDCRKQNISWTHGKFPNNHKSLMYDKGNCYCLKEE